MKPHAGDGSDILFVSLGETCQTAYQLGRLTRKHGSLFFDWLITPSSAYKSLTLDADAFFRTGNWELVDEGGIRLRDKGTDLRFQHEFPVVDNVSRIIDPARVEAHLEKAKSKFLHLRNKTVAAIRDSKRVCLVRYEWVATSRNARWRINDIRKHFSTLNPHVKIVIASPVIDAEELAEDHAIVKIREGKTWHGDNESWKRLLGLAASL